MSSDEQEVDAEYLSKKNGILTNMETNYKGNILFHS